MPTDIVKIEGSDNQQHEINSKITRGIVRATMDSSSTSTAFIATAPNITELYDGLSIIMKNTVVTSASGCTINLNNLGAKNIYNSRTGSSITTAYANGSEYIFNFDYANDRWVLQVGYYTSDADTIGEYAGDVSIDSNGYNFDGGILLMTQLDPPLWSAVTTTGGTGTKKAKCTLGFLPNGKVLRSTSSVTGGERTAQSDVWWSSNNVNLRYWTNCSTTTLPSSVLGKAVYLKCTMSNGLLYVADAPWWAVELPSTADGYYYVYIGQMYTRYQATFSMHHPIYYHDGTGIREYIADAKINDLKANYIDAPHINATQIDASKVNTNNGITVDQRPYTNVYSNLDPIGLTTRDITLHQYNTDYDPEDPDSEEYLEDTIVTMDPDGDIVISEKLRKSILDWKLYGSFGGATISTPDEITIPDEIMSGYSELRFVVEMQVSTGYKTSNTFIFSTNELIHDKRTPIMYNQHGIMFSGYHFTSTYYGSFGVEYDRDDTYDPEEGMTFRWSTAWAKAAGQGTIQSEFAYRVLVYYR